MWSRCAFAANFVIIPILAVVRVAIQRGHFATRTLSHARVAAAALWLASLGLGGIAPAKA